MQELMLMIKNPGEGQWLQHIDWNKAEFERAIEEAVKDYQNVAYSEDQIKQAKTDRAELNKLKKAIDDRRKEVKKTISAPYDQFEKEVKEVTKKLDDAVSQIDSQVKASEARQKEEKKALILDYFREALVKANQADIDAEVLCDASWLNASASMAQVKKAIDAKVTNIQNGYAFCDNLPDDERTIALMTFEKAYDIGMAISEVNLYRQKKAAEEEARQHEENQKKLAEMTGEPIQKAEEVTPEPQDALSAALSEGSAKIDIDEHQEDQGEEQVIKTISIPFNGTNLDSILGAIRITTMPKRGTITVSFCGTPEKIESTLLGLAERNIKFREQA